MRILNGNLIWRPAILFKFDGNLIWGILPWDKGISWEGHFWGLFVGLVLAYFYRKQGPQRKEFVWPEDENEKQPLGEEVEFEEILDDHETFSKSIPKPQKQKTMIS